jgi:hypothetical protein
LEGGEIANSESEVVKSENAPAAQFLGARLGDAGFAIPIATAFLFMNGWFYTETYYKYFGVDHRTLGLPFYAYLLNPWYSLLVHATWALLWFGRRESGGLASVWIDLQSRVVQSPTPGVFQRLRKMAISVDFLASLITSLGIGFALWLFVTAVGRDGGIVWLAGVTVFLFCYVWPRPSESALVICTHRCSMFVYIIFVLLVLTATIHNGAKDAILDGGSATSRLPKAWVSWVEREKEERTNPFEEDALNLKMLYSTPEGLYLFKPTASADSLPPRVYHVPRDKIRYSLQGVRD